ncbi:MAG: tRNA (adenine(57)-N(1)/adenine(58)-N(1))-methyltransferase TrmI [ANME-2 cluster archaeon]|nr:tRNA (adenine(57)-N(1)/adenine(58)-N(1))-methyltransferase TrmI [ANME-2 cluster archaeon]
MKPGDPVLLKGNGKNYFVTAGSEDLHTEVGVFKLDRLPGMEYGDSIVSHLGFELKTRRPRAPDFFKKLKRTGAPVNPKDIGMIISHTGMNKNDIVLDAGTGSGILAIYVGLVVKRVLSYEFRQDFLDVARSNIALAGLDNVEVRYGDILQEINSIDETFDVVTLDLHHASEVVPFVPDVLNPGGFFVVFSPFMEQAKDVRQAISMIELEEVVTFECTQREISFSERGTRPSTIRVGHSGYVTFARIP